MYTNTKTIILNSKNRIGGTDGSFTYKLTELLTSDVDRIVCMSCLIPKSYYLIQTGINDTFTLTESGSSASVTLSAGNYTLNSLKTNLASKLNIASPHSYTYAITYPSSTQVDTGKLTFTVSGNGSVQPSFTFSSSSPYEILGFAINSTNTFVSSSLTSTNVIKLQKEDAIKILSDVCDDGLLCVIFAGADPVYSNIVYRCVDVSGQSKKISSNGKDVYSFSICNEDNIKMNLNGQNIVLELLIYKDQSTHLISHARMAQGFMKYSLINDQQNNNLLEQ